jgi:hypothetical protein
MALTRLTGANAISGEIPAANFNNASLTNVTALPSSIATGDLQFISKQTASSSASISFTSGIDSTYKEYIFFFKNIHPENDGGQFRFQTSTDGGSSYGVTLTSTYFIAYHKEDGSETSLTYITGSDKAQSTDFMVLGSGDNENDSGISGYMHLFNPSSTTFVKHWFARTINDPSGYAQDEHTAGYFNTTSAIDAVQFKMASGDIDSGDILLYGVK